MQHSAHSPSTMADERRLIAKHGVTVLIGQLAVMAYSVTDTIVAGQHSTQAQAALSVAAAIFISVYVSLLAAVQALLPIWAELLGSGRKDRIGQSVRQSVYLTGGLTLIGITLLVIAPQYLAAMKVPNEMHSDVRHYLFVLAAALPAAMAYRVFSALSQSLGQPQLVTWLQVVGLGVKIPLSILLVQGVGPIPALGIAGCAWATLVVHYSLLSMAIWMSLKRSVYRPLQLWQRLEPLQLSAQRQFLRLAAPAGMLAFIEISSFSLMALFIARQGAIASSAHQIASNMAGIAYMFPLSLAIAASARVSFWRGAGHDAYAKRITQESLRTGLFLAIAIAIALICLRSWLVTLYSPDTAVQVLAAGLLFWIALYHCADSMQLLCIFLLRSWHVTVTPMLVYPLMLWGFGVAGGYMLAYHGLGPWPAQQSPWPFWAASALGLALTGIVLTLLLHRVLKKVAHPPRAC